MGNDSQSTIDLVNISLQVVTIIVLIFTCIAAFRQARAARKLIEATEQQIKTSESMAAAANAQNEIARLQIDENVRPILIFVWDVQPDYRMPRIQNDGAGPAVDCRWYYGQITTTSPEAKLFPREVLGTKQATGLEIDEQKARNEGLTFVYKSLTGKQYATEVTWFRGEKCVYREYARQLDLET